MSILYTRLRVRKIMLQPEIDKEPEPEPESNKKNAFPVVFFMSVIALLSKLKL